MSINVTNDVSSLVALTRQLNSQNLARIDEAKRQADQLAADQQRQADGDKAAKKLANALRQSNTPQATKTTTDKTATETNTDQAVNGDEAANQKNGRSLARQQDNNNGQTLASLVPPKANLSPSDELAIFAETSGQQSKSPISADAESAQLLATTSNSGNAVDEDGSQVDVEIITPQAATPSNAALVLTLTSRAQAATAALYARNSDVVFQSYPLSQVAA